MQNKNKPLKSILILSFLAIFVACKPEFKTPELERNFTSAEISDLEKLVDFFKANLCENNTSNFNKCFEEFAPKWIENGLDFSTDKITFEELENIYAEINQNTFDEIWDFCMTYQIRPTEREFLDICSKKDGKYQKFLKDFGKSNKLVEKYYNQIIAAGDFNESGGIISQIWNDRKEIDLDNPNYQVLISIHILTMNDQFLRNRTESDE